MHALLLQIYTVCGWNQIFFLHRENKSNEHLGNSVLLRLIIIWIA